MREPNTECRVCGKKYYACSASKTMGGYKMVACSPECFKKYQIDVMLERGEDIPNDLQELAKERIKLREQRLMVELGVVGEEIEEVSDNTELDSNSNKTTTKLAEKIKNLVKSN